MNFWQMKREELVKLASRGVALEKGVREALARNKFKCEKVPHGTKPDSCCGCTPCRLRREIQNEFGDAINKTSRD